LRAEYEAKMREQRMASLEKQLAELEENKVAEELGVTVQRAKAKNAASKIKVASMEVGSTPASTVELTNTAGSILLNVNAGQTAAADNSSGSTQDAVILPMKSKKKTGKKTTDAASKGKVASKEVGTTPASTVELTDTAGSSLLNVDAGQTAAADNSSGSTQDAVIPPSKSTNKRGNNTIDAPMNDRMNHIACTHLSVISLHREDTPSYLNEYKGVYCACGKELWKCRHIGRCNICKQFGLCNTCYDNKMSEEPRTRKRIKSGNGNK